MNRKTSPQWLRLISASALHGLGCAGHTYGWEVLGSWLRISIFWLTHTYIDRTSGDCVDQLGHALAQLGRIDLGQGCPPDHPP